MPKIFKETHKLLTLSLEQLIMTKEYYIDGVMRLDNESISEGIKHMDKSEMYFDEFSEKFNKLMDFYR